MFDDFAIVHEAGEAHGQSRRQALEPSTLVPVAHDDEPRIEAACPQLRECLDRAVRSLLDGQPAD